MKNIFSTVVAVLEQENPTLTLAEGGVLEQMQQQREQRPPTTTGTATATATKTTTTTTKNQQEPPSTTKNHQPLVMPPTTTSNPQPTISTFHESSLTTSYWIFDHMIAKASYFMGQTCNIYIRYMYVCLYSVGT